MKKVEETKSEKNPKTVIASEKEVPKYLTDKKEKIIERLSLIDIAEKHPEHNKENTFEFKFANLTNPNNIQNQNLYSIYERAFERNLGLDVDIIIEEINNEATEQYKSIVRSKIKGLGIKGLMELRNACERMVLSNKREHFERSLAEVETEITIVKNE